MDKFVKWMKAEVSLSLAQGSKFVIKVLSNNYIKRIYTLSVIQGNPI